MADTFTVRIAGTRLKFRARPSAESEAAVPDVDTDDLEAALPQMRAALRFLVDDGDRDRLEQVLTRLGPTRLAVAVGKVGTAWRLHLEG